MVFNGLCNVIIIFLKVQQQQREFNNISDAVDVTSLPR